MHEWGEPFDWSNVSGDLLQVSSQKHKPKCAAVAVKYRDNWFYIDDRNLSSKSTFTLLLQLFELQAGGGATGTNSQRVDLGELGTTLFGCKKG